MQKKIINENQPEQSPEVPFYKTPKFKKLVGAILLAVASYFGVEVASPGTLDIILGNILK
jgi:hypothetical protein